MVQLPPMCLSTCPELLDSKKLPTQGGTETERQKRTLLHIDVFRHAVAQMKVTNITSS